MRKFLELTLKFLSKAILQKYHPRVVAITGSAGKTSAKEAIFLVLNSARPGRVRANLKNFNTEIGVPLTVIGGADARRNIFLWLVNLIEAAGLILFRNKNYPEILVLEMAADKPGDIKYLTSFVQPDVAVVTAIGEMPTHLEFFPERDAYISEKANILKNLKPYGVAILNYDDLSVRDLRDRVPTDRARVYYGLGKGADIRISDFSFIIPAAAAELAEAGIEFKMEYNGETAESKFYGTIGVPPLYAALAAAAVGSRFEVKLKQAALYLKDYRPPQNRLELKAGVKETVIIDDTYNASPLSTAAALELLAQFKKNRRLAALGSMKELGVNTEAAHRLVGRQAAQAADLIFLVGGEMVFAKEEAIKHNFKLDENLFWFETADEAKTKVQEMLKSGDAVLIKGSRAVKMEAIVKEIEVRI